MISSLPGLVPPVSLVTPPFSPGTRGWEQFGAPSEFPSISNQLPVKGHTQESFHLRKPGFLSLELGAPELFLGARARHPPQVSTDLTAGFLCEMMVGPLAGMSLGLANTGGKLSPKLQGQTPRFRPNAQGFDSTLLSSKEEIKSKRWPCQALPGNWWQGSNARPHFVGPCHLSPSLCVLLGPHVGRQVRRRWNSLERPPRESWFCNGGGKGGLRGP